MLRRRVVGLVLAATVGWLPAAPPEHVHDAEDHGRQHVLVHRHSAPHTFTHDAPHHDAVLDDHDAPILTLDMVYAAPSGVAAATEPPPAVVTFGAPLLAPIVARTPEYFGTLIHGPPRAPVGLRAPPRSARL